MINICSPQSKVITQQLENESGILVVILLQRIKVGNSAIKSMLRQLASLPSIISNATYLIWVIQDLVIEYRVVQSQSQQDRNGGRQIRLLASLHRLLVSTCSSIYKPYA